MLGTNMMPKRQVMRSNMWRGNGSCSASAARKSMFLMPRAEAFSSAISSISRRRSVAVTRPSGPTAAETLRAGSPEPAARSRTCMPRERAAPLTTSSVAWRDWKASWEYHFFQAGAAESQSWRMDSLGSGVGDGLVDIIAYFEIWICGCKEGSRSAHRVHRGGSVEGTEKAWRRVGEENPGRRPKAAPTPRNLAMGLVTCPVQWTGLRQRASV